MKRWIALLAAFCTVMASNVAHSHLVWPATGVGGFAENCEELDETALDELAAIDANEVLFTIEGTGNPTASMTAGEMLGHTMYLLAVCKIIATDRPRDMEGARDHLKDASRLGNASAEHTLASLNLFVSDDNALQAEGFSALETEAAEHSAWAVGKLGYAKFKGLGTEADEAEALRLYRLAAESGMTPWIYVMAHIYERGLLGVESDLEKRQYWLDFEPKIHTGDYTCTIAYLYSVGQAFPTNDAVRNDYRTRCDESRIENITETPTRGNRAKRGGKKR